MRSSTSPPNRTSIARSSIRRRSSRPASSASTSCSRRAGSAPARRASCRSRPTRSTARSTRGTATEDDRLAPRSPYAAAKAAGELLVGSYVVTHGVDAVVTRGSNTYGPYHHPEKLIPLFITNAIDDRALPLYGDGLQRREWLYVGDHAAAIDHVLRHGASGETYNLAGRVGADQSRGGGAPARAPRQAVVARDAGRGSTGPRSALRDGRRQGGGARLATGDLVRGRPGRDRRVVSGERAWWRAARSGDWDSWYARQYAGRLATGQAATVNSPRPTRPGIAARPADACRGHRGRRTPRQRARLGARGRTVHRRERADRLATRRVRP